MTPDIVLLRQRLDDWSNDIDKKEFKPDKPPGALIRAAHEPNSYLGWFEKAPTAKFYCAGDDAKLRLQAVLEACSKL